MLMFNHKTSNARQRGTVKQSRAQQGEREIVRDG